MPRKKKNTTVGNLFIDFRELMKSHEARRKNSNNNNTNDDELLNQ